MIYLLAAYHSPHSWEALPAAERAAFEEACRRSESSLHRRGYLLAAAKQAGGCSTLRVQAGRPGLTGARLSLAAGLQVAGEEVFSELLIVAARDLNEVVRLAGDLPHARRGPLAICQLAVRHWAPFPG